jgi:DNA processing protein
VEPDPVRLAWLRLALAEPSGRLAGARLAAALGGPEAAARAPPARLAALLGPARGRRFHRALRAARPVAVHRRAREAGQRVLTPADEPWPTGALAGLEDAPCALFAAGTLPAAGEPAAAVVGTRDATPYGLRMARDVAAGLGRAGVWVVSGLALGIDGAAHEGAVQAGGRTLAVLGCGLDHPYPVAHLDLRERLLETGGGLLSEHPPGCPPRRHHFPRRNRLVAALSGAVVVVEAAARSGALITARLALEQGREVLAVPGNVGQPARAGVHRLLREGAALCEGAGDVLAVLGLSPGEARATPVPLPPGPAAAVLRALDEALPRDAGWVCVQTRLDASRVAALLMELEMQGRVRRLPGAGFVRA